MTGRDAYAPLSDGDWPAELADLKDGFAGGLNVYRAMAHHPGLLRAWAGLREHVVNHTALGPERAEVVILRAAHRLGVAYAWSQHFLRARAAGLTEARIGSIRGVLAGMSPEAADMCGAVVALFDDGKLAPHMVAELTAHLG